MSYLSLEGKRALETAIATMQQGGVIAFPTDTVYGIGAALDHPEALSRIFDIKGRPADRPLPLLVSRPDIIASLTVDPDRMLLALAARFWPGPLTVVLTASPSLPPEVVTADGTVEAAIVGDPAATPFGFTIVAEDSAPTSLLLQFAQVPQVELLNPAQTDDALRYFVAIDFGIVFLTAASLFGSTIAQSVV